MLGVCGDCKLLLSLESLFPGSDRGISVFDVLLLIVIVNFAIELDYCNQF